MGAHAHRVTSVYELLHGRTHEDVTDAAYGANQLRIARIVFELLPQVADVDVERSIDRRIVFAAFDGARELLARDGLSGAARERDEDAHLERRQLDLRAG